MIDKLQNIEIINIQEKNGKLVAIISYQDLSEIHNINNGYNWQEVPVNIREMQKSSRDNYLVDQSEKFFVDVAIVSKRPNTSSALECFNKAQKAFKEDYIKSKETELERYLTLIPDDFK